MIASQAQFFLVFPHPEDPRIGLDIPYHLFELLRAIER
jgi:hypothetical protein